MDKQEKKGLALGAVFGAIAGVVAGILFAPKSGKETRKDIKVATVKTINKAKEEAEKLHEEVSELIQKLEAKLKDLKGKTSQSAKEHIEDGKKTVSNLKIAIKSFKEGASDDKDLQTAIKKAQESKAALKEYLKK
ncbi:YtxH domain-containing protein [Candidatus Saccharibacteria bacterium]|nr:YtxH domain-containing protein [Candidatus Saccharibacteria bacterium]